MKRRTFIRNIGILSATTQLPTHSLFAHTGKSAPFQWVQGFTLKEFDDEHEEHPRLVTDNKGGNWLFSLRRFPYPENKEVISSFYLRDKNWVEQPPVTSSPGQYEYPVASCANGGNPMVAWTSIEDGKWSISVAEGGKKGFGDSFTFQASAGKYIKPVLITPKITKIRYFTLHCFRNTLTIWHDG